VENVDFIGIFRAEEASQWPLNPQNATGSQSCSANHYKLCWFTLLVPPGRAKLAVFADFG
jgi:hypothetical protein